MSYGKERAREIARGVTAKRREEQAREVGMVGARVRYCGHRGVFVADVIVVAGAAVIRANGPIEQSLDRSDAAWESATHHVVDFPTAGYWNPRLGVLVVPASQVTRLDAGATGAAGAAGAGR